MPSFDTVSELDDHEVTNAIDQANRELTQRFDFKDTGAEFARDAKDPYVVLMKAKVEFQLKQMLDILKMRLAKREIDTRCLEVKDPEVNIAEARQKVILKHGINQETAKKVTRLLKESGLKVQAQIQADQVRVSSPSRDDLQHAMGLLRQDDFGVELNFGNYR